MKTNNSMATIEGRDAHYEMYFGLTDTCREKLNFTWQRIRPGIYACEPVGNIVMQVEKVHWMYTKGTHWFWRVWDGEEMVAESQCWFDTMKESRQDCEDYMTVILFARP